MVGIVVVKPLLALLVLVLAATTTTIVLLTAPTVKITVGLLIKARQSFLCSLDLHLRCKCLHTLQVLWQCHGGVLRGECSVGEVTHLLVGVRQHADFMQADVNVIDILEHTLCTQCKVANNRQLQ